MESEFTELAVVTTDGDFKARYSVFGLKRLQFPAVGRTPPKSRLTDEVDGVGARQPSAQVLRWHRATESALKRVLTGQAPTDLPPIDWIGTTEFQQAVWRQMLKLGPGKTMSYSEIAAAIGKPRAVRAVGGACGANPIPVLVPCHRVLAAHGRLGGFSGGLNWKRRLLAREGIGF